MIVTLAFLPNDPITLVLVEAPLLTFKYVLTFITPIFLLLLFTGLLVLLVLLLVFGFSGVTF